MRFKNSIRNAVANVFSYVEPVRYPDSLYYEGLGRLVDAGSADELNVAGAFIHQKGPFQILSDYQRMPDFSLEQLHASKAIKINEEALLAAGRQTPRNGSLEQWFKDVAAKAPKALSLAEIPSVIKSVAYRKSDSVYFEAIGRLHIAELYSRKNPGAPRPLNDAGQFIVVSKARELVGIERYRKLAEKHETAAQDIMSQGQRGYHPPHTLTEIEHNERETGCDMHRRALVMSGGSADVADSVRRRRDRERLFLSK